MLSNQLLSKFNINIKNVSLNEGKNRDCDYIISVNFVTFLILWKIKKYDEAKRYIEINRKMIETVLEDDLLSESKRENITSLSVILESTN